MADQGFFPSDKPREECGVFGISATHQESARQTYFGIFALQHRGQEAAGIAVSDGQKLRIHKDVGLVSQIFAEENIAYLKGHLAIGHTRYSTTGSSNLRNVQPMLLETRYGPVALAHNGNLVNAIELRIQLMEQGIGFTSTSDTEVMLTMLATANGETWIDRISEIMPKWKGAYSLVVLTTDGLYAARDPWGIRPLTLGRLPGGGYAVASETGALETIGCDSIREVHAGEVVSIHQEALIVKQAVPAREISAKCTFEHIYFSRPDSIWDGKVVHDVRVRLGKQIAVEMPTEADVVIPVPDSSIPAALGYSRESGISYDIGLLKNRYIGRTFIQPSQEMRVQDVNLKFNPIPSVIKGKRVIVIDDSIVRGTTSKHLVDIIRKAGAKEIHFRLTCPPITNNCYMGVDMSSPSELIAHNKNVEEIREFLQADSLHFLSLDGMMGAIGAEDGYCNACFTGKYPFSITDQCGKMSLEGGLD
jgi:amidophosphoribosyltransferase